MRGKAMSKAKLTWPEIQAKYPDQWVALKDCEMKKGADIISGVVAYTESDISSDEMVLKAVKEGNLQVRFTTPRTDFGHEIGALMA